MQLDFIDQQSGTPSHISSGFPDKMVILDCETTGGRATYHRIIEIGLLVVEGGELIETWQSFVNPETTLPPFIQKLTGIQPSMIAGAPVFSDIAQILLDKLQGRTLVAHNARFDYGFLKNEFERAGIAYNSKPLCSVKFSRNLYSQFKQHGLSAIIKRFHLSIANRHRALDDAEIIYQFFLKTTALFTAEDIDACCKKLLKHASLPALLEAREIEKLPSAAGVYYFYDSSDLLLYVGKSVNIRNRVMSHFSSDYRHPKDLQISAKITHIDFELTPTDFGAQLRESQQIKKLSPIYNRRLRKVRKLFQYCSERDSQGYQRISIQAITASSVSDSHFGLFRSPRQASLKLEQLADEFLLCHRLLGLEGMRTGDRGKPCFRSQLKKCLGACHGLESATSYNQRLNHALERYQMHAWPYPCAILVEERNSADPDLAAFHIIDRWQYIAQLDLAEDIYEHGYHLLEDRSLTMPTDHIPINADKNFDLDTYFILIRFLLNSEKMQLNNIKLWPLGTGNK